jgi:alkaline phosphatase D
MLCRKLLVLVYSAVSIFLFCTACSKQIPYQTTGIKIGEVTDTSAIIWTRLTVNQIRPGSEAKMPIVEYNDTETGEWGERKKGRPDQEPRVIFPEGYSASTIEGACPGMGGEVRIFYKGAGDAEWQKTEWQPVDPEADFTRQIKLENLKPATKYDIQVESKADDYGQVIKGLFRTAPEADSPTKVSFLVTTGTAYPDMDLPDEGYKMYQSMVRMNPSFFVHTGDILYYDKLAKTKELALWHWQRMYSLPTNIEFHRQVASYFIKDDHDTWMNDCWPTRTTRFMGDFTFNQGLDIFPQQVPMSEKTYRTFRWGKDLQIWLVEGRDFRSPNTMPDGPEKTIWGKEQKEWFKKTVLESDATFRLLISPTPIVGPDRNSKGDNHSNAVFKHEGDELRKFISEQKNMFTICGDRHWQYVSVDREFGVKEYSCGPASDEHAGGWSNDKLRPEHQYLNVTGGFLAITVGRTDGLPILSAAHYSVDGDLLNLDQVEAK